MNSYIVYKATAPSNSCYIGITYRGLDKRKWEHYNKANKGETKTPLAKAIQKYGKSIVWEVLDLGLSKQEAKDKEILYISELKAQGIKLYNVTLGGDIPWNSGKTGFKWSEESIAKRTESRKNYKHSEETKQKMSKSSKGCVYSKEVILKGIRSRNTKPVEVFTLDGIFVGIWENKSECCRELGLLVNKMAECLNGTTLSHRGYKFKLQGLDFARTTDKRYKVINNT
jgi:group I intron endonuclease